MNYFFSLPFRSLFAFIAISLLLSTISVVTNAVPAYPNPIQYTQPDGSEITILLKGDEKIKWAQTLDGYSILISNEGYYEYGMLNSKGDLVSSGVKVSDLKGRSNSEVTFLKSIKKNLFFSPVQVSIMKQIWDINDKEAANIKAFPTTGNRKLICILIGFPDLAFTKTQAEFNALFNQVGYNVGGATGSVKDYYLENSYGQFNLTVDVAGPYTASQNMVYYGGNNTSGNDSNPRALAAEAVNLANPDVNYADYDNDNDGAVDGVYIIYAGYGEEAGGGNNPNAIWAHAWNLSPSLNLDGKIISKYSCSAELRGNSGANLTRIGVICHEFGHVLGAPDYYDTNYATGGQYDGTGKWDMMAGGSWNNSGATPAHHNAFTKVQYYSWASAQLLNDPTSITLDNSAENSNSFYRINTATTNEYFIIENRQKHMFDAYIPGSGMIIYHVHSGVFSVGNSINATHPQRMYPICANAGTDPSSEPSSYGNINSDGTPFPGSGNKTSFTDLTLPSSKSWAGVNTGKPITNIVRDAIAKTVTFDFMGGASGNPTQFVATPISNSQINLSWNKNDGKDVLVAFSTSATFGTLIDGTSYAVGQIIPGGGKIVYAGSSNTFSHINLTASTTYYYKIWSKLTDDPNWSNGIEGQATTLCNVFNMLPFTENFATATLPSCWNVIDNQGNGQVWQFGTLQTGGLTNGSGNYAFLNSDGYGSGSSQNTDLISPTFDFSNYTNINLSFNHYYRHYTGSSAQLFYSLNGGQSWVQIQQWVANTANNATFSQSLEVLAGEPSVQLKWKYIGTWGYYWSIDNIQVTGNQIAQQYSLTLISNPEGAGALTGAGTYTAGTTITLSAMANPGFEFVNWTNEGEEVSSLPTFTYTTLSSDVTLSANFNAIVPQQFTLTVVLDGEGDVKVDGNSFTDPITLNENTSITVEASPALGYHFENWSGDLVSINSTETIIMDGNKELTAHFAINSYTLNYLATAYGSISGNTNQTVNYGSNGQPVEAVALEGYHFIRWSDGLTSNPRVDENVTNDIIVTAEFAINTYTISFIVEGNGRIDINGTPYSVPVIAEHGSSLFIEAISDDGWQFAGWNGAITGTEPTINLIVSMEIAAMATFTETTGANSSVLSNVLVFPNPFRNKLQLGNVKEFECIILSNILGQKVAEFYLSNEDTFEIATESIARGVYFLTLISKEKQKSTLKLIRE
jgi:M6 family metalloprotease-like protein